MAKPLKKSFGIGRLRLDKGKMGIGVRIGSARRKHDRALHARNHSQRHYQAPDVALRTLELARSVGWETRLGNPSRIGTGALITRI